MTDPSAPVGASSASALTRRERRLRRALIGVSMVAALLVVAIGVVIGYWHLYLLGPTGDPFTRGPYLVRVGPQDAELRWRATEGSRVLVTARDLGGGVVSTDGGRIRGLQPGRRYTWAASVNGQTRAAGSFVTPPPRAAPQRGADTAIRFAFLADYGDGSDEQWSVAKTMAAWRPDLVVTGGDNSYLSAPDILLDRNIFRPLGEVMRHAPVYVGLGDHDMLPPGDDAIRSAFDIPPSRRYVVQHGWVQIVILGNDAGGDSLPFARRALSAPGFTRRFVVVHRPLRRGDPILPLLRRARVDAVFSGNLHLYERRIVDGVQTFTAGTGGVGTGRSEFTPRSDDADRIIDDFGHLQR